ncbi:hypothetical protein AG1IA_02783 [Rhizoctonia solani AG-1 IA]|uniref:Uncharacterized protein n=1 Tax=Thanatephorus cucumeris (strain AG1-IA) TaxID=983506 RepID=L8WYN0_THACA|nr:hypothetical protein AG1IA_02783 [Rhizoctonia solani AG-1 IA]
MAQEQGVPHSLRLAEVEQTVGMGTVAHKVGRRMVEAGQKARQTVHQLQRGPPTFLLFRTASLGFINNSRSVDSSWRTSASDFFLFSFNVDRSICTIVRQRGESGRLGLRLASQAGSNVQ